VSDVPYLDRNWIMDGPDVVPAGTNPDHPNWARIRDFLDRTIEGVTSRVFA
jgi:hypothetical protein